MAGHPYRTRGELPYSRPVLAQGDLIALRDFRRVTDPVTATKLAIVAAALGYIDFAAMILRHHAALIDGVARRYGMDLAGDLQALSARSGKAAPAMAIRDSLRGLVPLGRSLMGGLPDRES